MRVARMVSRIHLESKQHGNDHDGTRESGQPLEQAGSGQDSKPAQTN